MKKEYRGIDIFRFIACLMVIAVHTSPLSNSFYSTQPISDFILTRIICRLAVPFFFMTSGYFLVKNNTLNTLAFKDIRKFIYRILKLYLFAIILYLPINIYTNYFSSISLASFINDLLLNGTFYHLWYLPASIIGVVIVYYLFTHISSKRVIFFIVLFLYAIGLVGNSYYYLFNKLPLFHYLLAFFDNTRNGILFAPIFIYLGVLIAIKKEKIPNYKIFSYLCISLFLLLTEGLLLHYFKLQKFDSLYIFLLPTSFFLFHFLLTFNGKGIPFIRHTTTLVYIIHPFIIIVMRLVAKLIPLLLPFNNFGILQFISVSIVSFCIAFLYYHIKSLQRNDQLAPTSRAWIEINHEDLQHNLQLVRGALSKNCQIMAVVKADAYGHGAISISKSLNSMGIHSFAVATIQEAIELRKHGVKGAILILGYTNYNDLKYLKKYDITQTIFSYEYALQLYNYPKTKVHIKIDTGMNRLGINYKNFSEILKIYQLDFLQIEGTYSHLACCDSLKEDDIAFTKHQINNFNKTIHTLKKYGIDPKNTHLQSTYGLLNYPDLQYDSVRVGLGLYGILSSPEQNTNHLIAQLMEPILSLKARVSYVKQVDINENIGYGNIIKTKRPTKIATIAIGYGDGYPRCLSNQEVIIKGYKAPIIGRICMDQMMVDITDIPIDINQGDVITLINKELRVELLAQAANTITNEFLTGFNKRLPIIESKKGDN